ncbi:MAG: hypothetical protein MI919_42335, partial [Holophagales bacterium]|nr:hypothetical protein [Holophagales bacterium]
PISDIDARVVEVRIDLEAPADDPIRRLTHARVQILIRADEPRPADRSNRSNRARRPVDGAR